MSRSALGSCCRFRSASAASRLSTRPLPAPMVPALRLTLARSDVRFAGVSPSGPPNVLAVSRSMNQRTAAKSLFFSYVTPRFSSLSSTGAKAGGAAVPVPASSVKTAARQGAGSALLRQTHCQALSAFAQLHLVHADGHDLEPAQDRVARFGIHHHAGAIEESGVELIARAIDGLHHGRSALAFHAASGIQF